MTAQYQALFEALGNIAVNKTGKLPVHGKFTFYYPSYDKVFHNFLSSFDYSESKKYTKKKNFLHRDSAVINHRNTGQDGYLQMLSGI